VAIGGRFWQFLHFWRPTVACGRRVDCRFYLPNSTSGFVAVDLLTVVAPSCMSELCPASPTDDSDHAKCQLSWWVLSRPASPSWRRLAEHISQGSHQARWQRCALSPSLSGLNGVIWPLNKPDGALTVRGVLSTRCPAEPWSSASKYMWY